MGRRTDGASWEVRESFETTRMGRQCLIDAYARLVPVHRKSIRQGDREHREAPAVSAPKRRGRHV
jgi:hypothetical protein